MTAGTLISSKILPSHNQEAYNEGRDERAEEGEIEPYSPAIQPKNDDRRDEEKLTAIRNDCQVHLHRRCDALRQANNGQDDETG